jgi:chromosome segregation ATPase
MDTDKNVQVGNEELQKALDYMNERLGKKTEPETLEKGAIPHSATHEQANGGQIEHITQLAKGIAELAGLMKSIQEVQKAQTDRMDSMEKAMTEKKEVPGGAPDNPGEKEKKEEIKKSEETNEVLGGQITELTDLMKSFQTELQEIKKDLDTPVRRSAAGIQTLRKSFGGQDEDGGGGADTISKSRISNALVKAYEKTKDETYFDAVTLLDTGGKISPSLLKSLEELDIKI